METFEFHVKFQWDMFEGIIVGSGNGMLQNWQQVINTSRPRSNEQHFADDIFKCIFFNENVWISIKISLKFVPKGPIKNIPALVQIMAWRRSGDKPLSEPMVVSLSTHICVTRPRVIWTNDEPISTYMQHLTKNIHSRHFKGPNWITKFWHFNPLLTK